VKAKCECHFLAESRYSRSSANPNDLRLHMMKYTRKDNFVKISNISKNLNTYRSKIIMLDHKNNCTGHSNMMIML